MHVARGMLDYHRLPRELARVLLVDGLTITDSRARWRVCWRVHVGVHVARGMLDYSAQLSTALNYSSSHHSSCVRGSSGPSMRVSVLFQYSTASRFKLEHAVSVLPSPLSSLLSRMYAVRHTFTCIAYIMAAVGTLALFLFHATLVAAGVSQGGSE